MKIMKKKVLLGVVMLLIAVLGGIGAFNQMTCTNVSALLMENIEALTSNESGSAVCYQTMGYCSNASGIVQMCTTEKTGERCWIWVTNCRFC